MPGRTPFRVKSQCTCRATGPVSGSGALAAPAPRPVDAAQHAAALTEMILREEKDPRRVTVRARRGALGEFARTLPPVDETDETC